MGRDKAALLVDGAPLWQRQLACLRATEPAELFISGPPDGPYAGCGTPIVPDELPGCGPLAGLAAVLSRCTTPWLVVLAVDMPLMTAAYLRGLLEETLRTGRGAVPQFADGHWQPLAAVYPQDASITAAAMLARGERRMEAFVRELHAAGKIAASSVAAEDQRYFENWNSPDDLSRR